MHDTDAIRRDHPIADVAAASGLDLRQTGGRLTAVCPFHGDTRPSLVVYPANQSYFCFGCGAGGDVIDFVSRLHRVGFREAAAFLKGEQRLPSIQQSPRPVHAPEPELDLAEVKAIVEVAVAFFHDALWSHPGALTYLHDRGISERTARACRLGYGVRGLAAVLAERGLDLAVAEGLGLLADGRERFAGRIIIPDLIEGRATWFTGRRLDDREPRYLNLRLAKPLLGLARQEGDAVVLVEGPFDWLIAVEWGFAAGALLGTRVSGPAERQLDRFEQVYLAFDNDVAGQQATAELVARLGERAIPVWLPPGVPDVSSLAHHGGRGAFIQCILRAGREAPARQRAA
jgi:DNA primase